MYVSQFSVLNFDLEAEKSQIKVLTNSAPSKDPNLSLQMAIILSQYGREKGRSLLCKRATSSEPHPHLTTPTKAQPPNTTTLGVRVATYDFGERTQFNPQQY